MLFPLPGTTSKTFVLAGENLCHVQFSHPGITCAKIPVLDHEIYVFVKGHHFHPSTPFAERN